MKRFISLVSDLVNKLSSLIVIISTALFACLVFISVVFRYAFNHSILYSVELSKLLFIWSCFFAATIAFKNNNHIRFEFITSKIGKKGVVVTDYLIYASSLLFFTVLLVNSIEFTAAIWNTQFPILGYSQGWNYVPVILSSILFIIHSLDFLINYQEKSLYKEIS
jgi:TRAP-type C4-dicarboxylate transport system permease small subunit